MWWGRGLYLIVESSGCTSLHAGFCIYAPPPGTFGVLLYHKLNFVSFYHQFVMTFNWWSLLPVVIAQTVDGTYCHICRLCLQFRSQLYCPNPFHLWCGLGQNCLLLEQREACLCPGVLLLMSSFFLRHSLDHFWQATRTEWTSHMFTFGCFYRRQHLNWVGGVWRIHLWLCDAVWDELLVAWLAFDNCNRYGTLMV